MTADELFAEFRKLNVPCGETPEFPGAFIQDGKLVLRVDGRLLFMNEAHAYLKQLRAKQGPK